MDETTQVQEWLSHYKAWKAFLKITDENIQGLQKELELEAAPGAVHYDLVPGGGGFHGSQEEKALDKKQKLQERLHQLQTRKDTALSRIHAIDMAIQALDPINQKLIKLRGIEHRTWTATAIQCGIPDSTCRGIYKRLLETMACMIFGIGLD